MNDSKLSFGGKLYCHCSKIDCSEQCEFDFNFEDYTCKINLAGSLIEADNDKTFNNVKTESLNY